jgi:hypothetical protein
MPSGRRRLRRRRAASAAALAALLLVTAGCGEPAEPVARVRAAPAELSLPYPQAAEVTLSWQVLAAVEAAGGRPTVFVHLLDDEGAVARTFDHPFPRDWQPGAEASYPLTVHQSMLGPPLPQGTYRLSLGLYEGAERWALDAGEDLGRMEYEVARVEVPRAQPRALPEIEYFGQWSGLAAGADRQVLGYRWLGGRGELHLTDSSSPGRLGAVLEITDPPPGGSWVLDSGAEVPTLRVHSNCDGSDHTLSGSGRATLSVDVPASRACVVELVPNYRFVPAAGQPATEEAPPLARLTVVTWTPTGG